MQNSAGVQPQKKMYRYKTMRSEQRVFNAAKAFENLENLYFIFSK